MRQSRLDLVATMISDYTDEEFGSRRGQTSDRHLYHQDREVRAAHLEGGAKGIEAIMDVTTSARVQAREHAATKAAADAAAVQRNAGLKALRETRQPTAARHAHTVR